MSVFIKKLLQPLILSVISLTALSVSAGIVDTKHNLAHWSPYETFRAVSEDRVCIFCHTPHNASPAGPLWSHDLSVAITFKKYSSSTLQILVDPTARSESGYESSGGAGVVTGATKLCLGCHDGLTALGAITTGQGDITIEMNTETLGGRESGYEDAGTVNIQNKHPVSFRYDETGDVRDAINAVKGNYYGLPGEEEYGTIPNAEVKEMVRRAGDRIECTICHDPHKNNATDNRDILPFWISGEKEVSLVLYSSYEAVCVSCHSTSFGEYSFFGGYTGF